MAAEERQSPDVARDADARIGRHIAELRKGAGLTQSDLAERMRALGWKWSQQSCWAIENGRQMLRLQEAADLAHVLEVDVWWMLSLGDHESPGTRTDMRALHLATHALDQAVTNYELIRRRLCLEADSTERPLPSPWREDIALFASADALTRVGHQMRIVLAGEYGKRPAWAKNVGAIAERFFESWEKVTGGGKRSEA